MDVIQKRIPELDGIRGLAILMVIIWHFMKPLTWPVVEGSFQFYVAQILGLSWSGVDLFFVLSGYLITGILLDNRKATNVFKVFYTRRALRILPPYVVLICLYLFSLFLGLNVRERFSWLFGSPIPFWSYLLFLQNIYMGLRGTFGPFFLSITWSLAIEEQFYLLIPTLVVKIRREMIFGVFLFMAMLAVSLRTMLPGFHMYVWMPFRMDALLLGGMCAFMVRSPEIRDKIAQWRWLLRLVLGFFALALCLFAVSNFLGDFLLVWLALFYAQLLLITVTDSSFFLQKLFRFRPLIYFGTISYGLYLYHLLVIGLVESIVGGGSTAAFSIDSWLLRGFSFCLTLVVAAASYKWLEAPLLRYGKSFYYLNSNPETSVEKGL